MATQKRARKVGLSIVGFGSHLLDKFVFVRCLPFLLQPSEDADIHAAELGPQHADGKGKTEDAEDAEGRHERLAAVRGGIDFSCTSDKTPR